MRQDESGTFGNWLWTSRDRPGIARDRPGIAKDRTGITRDKLHNWKNTGRFQSLGSVLLKGMNFERNITHTGYTGGLHSASLNVWFGSRGRWYFKTVTNTFYTSEVLGRKKSEVSCFLFQVVQKQTDNEYLSHRYSSCNFCVAKFQFTVFFLLRMNP